VNLKGVSKRIVAIEKTVFNHLYFLKAKRKFKKPYVRKKKWKGTIDAETLIKNIYADRLISRR